MRSLHVKQAAAAAVLLALPLGLVACSSDGADDAVSSAASPSTSSSAQAPTTGSDDGSRTASPDGGKPTKAQVAAGMTDYFVGKGVPRSLVGGVATCVADKGYTKFSDATLRALKNGKIKELNPLDTGKLTKVTTDCLADGPVPSAG